MSDTQNKERDEHEAPRPARRAKPTIRGKRNQNPKSTMRQELFQGLNMLTNQLMQVQRQVQTQNEALGKLGQFVADRFETYVDDLPLLLESKEQPLQEACEKGDYIHYFGPVWYHAKAEQDYAELVEANKGNKKKLPEFSKADNYVRIEFLLDKWNWEDFDQDKGAVTFSHPELGEEVIKVKDPEKTQPNQIWEMLYWQLMGEDVEAKLKERVEAAQRREDAKVRSKVAAAQEQMKEDKKKSSKLEIVGR